MCGCKGEHEPGCPHFVPVTQASPETIRLLDVLLGNRKVIPSCETTSGDTVRDFKRINPMIERLRALWLAHPDLRLGQLIDCASNETAGTANDAVFYMEDEKLLRSIETLLITKQP